MLFKPHEIKVINLRKEEIPTGALLEARVDGNITIIRAQSNVETHRHLTFQVLKKIGTIPGFGQQEHAEVGLDQRVRRMARFLGIWNP